MKRNLQPLLTYQLVKIPCLPIQPHVHGCLIAHSSWRPTAGALWALSFFCLLAAAWKAVGFLLSNACRLLRSAGRDMYGYRHSTFMVDVP